MAIQTITYSDKQAMGTQPSIPDVNKVTEDDMNEIKSVVNNNANELSNVVESGSNTNGNYIKYADGTMICTKLVSGAQAITEAWGNGFTSGANATVLLGNWAVEFLDVPIISVTPGRIGSNYWLSGVMYTTKVQAGAVSILRFTSATSVDYRLHVIGIGKWK